MKLIDTLVEIIFPSRCVICDKLGSFWCPECQKRITFIKSQTCPSCNRVSSKGKYCLRHQRNNKLSGIISYGYFKESDLKKIVYAFKYEGVSALSDILAEKIVDSLQSENICFEMVSYVPITRRRQSWRGYNQSEELARSIALKLRLPLAPPLQKPVDTKPQVGLSRRERIQNLKNKISLNDKKGIILGKRILVVDDVTTTGTTLNECAAVYKKAGAKSVWGAVLAKE